MKHKNLKSILFCALTSLTAIGLDALTLSANALAGERVVVKASGFRGDVSNASVMTLGQGVWDGLVSFTVSIGNFCTLNYESGCRSSNYWLSDSVNVTDGLGNIWDASVQKEFSNLVLPVKIVVNRSHTGHFLNPSSIVNIKYDISRVNPMLNLNYETKANATKTLAVIGKNFPGVEVAFAVSSIHYNNFYDNACNRVTIRGSGGAPFELTAASPNATVTGLKTPIEFEVSPKCQSSRKESPENKDIDIKISIPLLRFGYPSQTVL